jgi:hypothetical protein
MNSKIIGVIAVVLFSGSVLVATAQTTKTTHKKVRTLTGCLQKTDEANEYKLTTAAGATWEVKSDSVKLGDHVGHTVTLTGAVSNPDMHGAKEDVKDEAKEHGMATDSKEHGHLTATSMKMVSDSCKM